MSQPHYLNAAAKTNKHNLHIKSDGVGFFVHYYKEANGKKAEDKRQSIKYEWPKATKKMSESQTKALNQRIFENLNFF